MSSSIPPLGPYPGSGVNNSHGSHSPLAELVKGVERDEVLDPAVAAARDRIEGLKKAARAAQNEASGIPQKPRDFSDQRRQQTPQKQKSQGRASSFIGKATSSAKSTAGNAVDFVQDALHTLFVTRWRMVTALVIVASLFVVGYLFTPWVAQHWQPFAVVGAAMWLIMAFQPWSDDWKKRFVRNGVSRWILFGITTAAAFVFIFGAPLAAKGELKSMVPNVSLINMPLVGGLFSGSAVLVQPERGMLDEASVELFGYAEDGQAVCAVGTTNVAATEGGMLNGVPFKVASTDQGMTVKFDAEPVHLAGFIVQGLVAPLTGVNMPNGSHEFLFSNELFPDATSIAMCWAP